MLLKDLRQLATGIAGLVYDGFFPIECLGCAKSGNYLCATCLESVDWQASQVCHFCKRDSLLGATCESCVSELDGVLVLAHYQGLMKAAIRAYKYQFVQALGPELAKLFIDFFASQNWPDASSLIVPVPLSKARLAWRGFNQSQLLAQSLAQTNCLRLDRESLLKTTHNVAQAKLSLKERLALSDQSFAWRGASLAGQTIIVVDDVISTGRTLSVIATVLKRAGAARVWGLVLARGD